MTGGTILLWAIALIYAAVFVMFAAGWIRRGVAYISRRRRVSQPRAVCRVRTQ